MPLTGVQHTTAAASWDKLEGTNLSHPRSGFHEVKGVKKKKRKREKKTWSNLMQKKARARESAMGARTPKVPLSKHQGEPEEPLASQGAEGETPDRTHQQGTAAHPTL